MTLPQPPGELSPGSVVWVYLRYSHEGQTIESQEFTVREWCAQHGLVIGRLFVDQIRTGARDVKRIEFLEMVRLLEHGQAAPAPRGSALPRGIIFWSFARMARNEIDAQYYKALLRKKGYVVFTLADDIPQGALAPVFEAFAHVKDAEYLRRVSDEVKRGLQFRVAKGVPHTGSKPILGYRRGERVYIGPKMRRVNGQLKQVGERWGYKLAKDPQTCDRVARAWDMALAGCTDYEIYHETHVSTNARVMNKFFRSVTYAGAVRLGEFVLWDAHEGYVTREQWEHVQQLRAQRGARIDIPERHPRRQHNPANLLSGIIRCGECGAPLIYSQDTLARGGTKGLRCSSKHATVKSCTLRQIRADTVHAAVIEWLAGTLFSRAQIFALRDEWNRQVSGDKTAQARRIGELKESGARLDREIKNLVQYIRTYGGNADVQAQITAAQSERTQATLELKQVQAQMDAARLTISDEVLEDLAAHIREDLLTLAPPRLRDLLRSVLVKAELAKNDTLTLYYSVESLFLALAQRASSGVFTGQWQPLRSSRLPVPGIRPALSGALHTDTITVSRPPVGYWSHRAVRKTSPGVWQ